MHPFIKIMIDDTQILFPLYGICILAGIVLAAVAGLYLTKKTKQNVYNFVIIAACAAGLGMIGAKVFYVLLNYNPKEYLSALFNTKAGYVFYGGFITGALGFYIGTKVAKCKLQDFLNIFACILPLAHCSGRIGCFLGGCCYGFYPYDGPFALHYTPPVITRVPVDCGVFPSQLLESFVNLILFIVLFVICIIKTDSIRKNFNAFFIYAFSYSVIRFSLEFLRGDVERGSLGILSTSQIISICLFLITTAFFVIIKLVERHARMVELVDTRDLKSLDS